VSDPAAAPIVVDMPEQQRLVVEHDGLTAELIYRVRADRLIIVHTGVPDELAGRGIAGALVRAAVSRAREQRLTVVPWCPFARKWLQDHPEVTTGMTVDWTPPPPPSE
jgi:predicted GNAT family acetyltransferase